MAAPAVFVQTAATASPTRAEMINCASTPSAPCRWMPWQEANSGHPGTPMALAPVAYCLWQRMLRFDPAHPIWPNRDRPVLSVGHASMPVLDAAPDRRARRQSEFTRRSAIRP